MCVCVCVYVCVCVCVCVYTLCNALGVAVAAELRPKSTPPGTLRETPKIRGTLKRGMMGLMRVSVCVCVCVAARSGSWLKEPG